MCSQEEQESREGEDFIRSIILDFTSKNNLRFIVIPEDEF